MEKWMEAEMEGGDEGQEGWRTRRYIGQEDRNRRRWTKGCEGRRRCRTGERKEELYSKKQ